MATLTKTLKFDDDVLAVLRSQVSWSADGLSAAMPPLDRKMYERISKAFDLMGGKWNRKAKATLFTTDPRPQVEGLIESGQLVVEKDGFFRTPPEVTRYILSLMNVGMGDYNWLEPEAGDGAMVKVLLEECISRPERIYCIEKNAARCEALRPLGVRVANGDFLKFRNSAQIPFHRILMNPPFEGGQDVRHVMRAYQILAAGGTMGAVMSEGAFFNQHNLQADFRRWLKQVHAYDEKLPEGSFKASGTLVNTRLIVITKNDELD